MRLKAWFASVTLICTCLLLGLAIRGCGRQLIRGQVIDSETGEPIEGAVVSISWWEPGSGPPGLAGSHDLEVAENISDAQGYFLVPKYSTFAQGREFKMAVYKKGYVCWSSEKVFPSYEKRKDFTLRNGMKIRLLSFKEKYSIEDHAVFTVQSAPPAWTPLFDEATKLERKLSGEVIQKGI